MNLCLVGDVLFIVIERGDVTQIVQPNQPLVLRADVFHIDLIAPGG